MTDNDTDPIRSLIGAVLRHRLAALRGAIILFALVATTTYLRTRTYTAVGRITAQSRRSVSVAASLATQLGFGGALGAEPQVNPLFYADLVRSPVVLRQVAQGAVTIEDELGQRQVPLARHLAPEASTERERIEFAVLALQRMVRAVVSQRTGLVALRVTTTDPHLSWEIGNLLFASLDSALIAQRREQAARERRFTEERLDFLATEMRAAEDSLEEFMKRNRAGWQTSPELGFEYERRLRAVTVRQEVYVAMAQAVEQARIDELRDTPAVSVVEEFVLPVWPDPRRLIVKGAAALLLGLVGGLAVGVLLRRLHPEPAVVEGDDLPHLLAATRADLVHPILFAGKIVGLRSGSRRQARTPPDPLS